MAAEWIRAQVFFASMYSYRVPNTSPSFAPASPVPGPSAVRLALVDAAIQQSGSVADGETVFELVKAAPLVLVPPERVSVIRVFTKRLKPGKGEDLVESTGIREYCHPLGPLEVYIRLPEHTQRIAGLFRQLRRLGTTDSLAWCSSEEVDEPAEDLACRPLDGVPGHLDNFDRRMVVSLLELPPGSTFDDVNPYSPPARGFKYRQQFWVLPLVRTQRGQNWTLYERAPFVSGGSP
jgi:hypothetical protein